ncbi:MAG: hypothetical protein JNK58_14025 [Phycisphaerae bacterium]|nr:hypothetical protein [Phycisphaerae bacterium]
MSRTRQILLVKIVPTDDEETPSILNSVPLGTLNAVTAQLERFNTSSDGSKDIDSFGLLYGPGFNLQLPMVGPNDPVAQVIVTMHEEDIAWPVLARICRTLNWKMMDPQSGRTFGG